jgi:stage II sporulation protein D
MILAGLVISTAGYFTLHFVDVRASNPIPFPMASPAESTHSELPPPASGPSPSIRVCLTNNPVSSLDLQIDGPYSLYALGNDKPLESGKSLKESRVLCQGQNIRFGNREFHSTRLEIVPKDSPAIWVNGHQYRGRLRISRQPGGKLLAINVLPLEDYIASVVDSEMPRAFPEAARQAQAICSRTYAVYQMGQSRSHPYFDVYSSTRSQSYQGYQYLSNGRRLAGETAEGRQIARQTAGLVCTDHGEVFCTYYSAVCGGRTTEGGLVFRDAAQPLKSVHCDYCKDAGLYRWTEKHSQLSASQKLASLLGTSRNQLTSINLADNKQL